MDERTILLHVRGTPHPQPRPRFIKHRKGARIVSIADKKTLVWVRLVDAAVIELRQNLGGLRAVLEILGAYNPIHMECVFNMPIGCGKSIRSGKEVEVGQYHTTVPDLDNLEKLIMDRLFIRSFSSKSWGSYKELKFQGLTFGDDRRIASKVGYKYWCNPIDAGCVVRLSRIGELNMDEVNEVLRKRGEASYVDNSLAMIDEMDSKKVESD